MDKREKEGGGALLVVIIIARSCVKQRYCTWISGCASKFRSDGWDIGHGGFLEGEGHARLIHKYPSTVMWPQVRKVETPRSLLKSPPDEVTERGGRYFFERNMEKLWVPIDSEVYIIWCGTSSSFLFRTHFSLGIEDLILFMKIVPPQRIDGEKRAIRVPLEFTPKLESIYSEIINDVITIPPMEKRKT